MVDEHKLIGFEYVIVGNECWSLGKESELDQGCGH